MPWKNIHSYMIIDHPLIKGIFRAKFEIIELVNKGIRNNVYICYPFLTSMCNTKVK